MRTSFPLPAPCVLRSLSAWLGTVLGGLRGAVAAWGGRDRAAVPLVVLAYGRLGRIAARFDALLALLARGHVPAPRRPEPPGRQRPGTPGLKRLPREAGWLARMLPEARGYASQLQALLADPAMAALLAEVPAASRLLRPLLRMLTMPEHRIANGIRRRAAPGAGCPREPATPRRAGVDIRPEQVLWPPEWTA